MNPITVAIAAHDGGYIAQCRQMLRRGDHVIVLRQAASGEDLVTEIARLKPRILLLDAGLSADAECTVLRALRRACPETRVVLVARAALRDEQLANALVVGVRGYLEEEDLEYLLARAVRGVDQGEAWVPRKMLGTIMTMASA